MARLSPSFLRQQLQLNDHVEGGGFAEVYRSALSFTKDQLPPQFGGSRYACTHIYFMLQKGQFSAFHRIRSDELWHFYSGDPLVIYEIREDGSLQEHLLGNDLRAGQSFFCVIKAGSWFASRLADNGEYGLVGCTVAPGFDFADFELAKEKELAGFFPQHAGLIKTLVRE